MKSVLIAFLAVLIVPAMAGIRLSSKVYEITELAQAKADATAKGKPISILYTDKDSTCPLCNAAAETMIKELGSKTVMVYVRSIGEMPPAVADAFNQGQYIPKIAVFDSSMERSLGLVTYEAVSKDERDAFREIEKTIRAYSKK